jgi:ABC-type transport system involved in multi-copper enzyme maturation permease subunit
MLAIPLMAVCLYIWAELAAWYICYAMVFNMLVGPVFSAGSVTTERERETLDLLLTTTITAWQILWGKLIAGLRVSSVLTMFLLWPVLLACVMVQSYWTNLLSILAYLIIVLLTCLTSAHVALFCSVLFRKTSVSLITSYLLIILLFCVPIAVNWFVDYKFNYAETDPFARQIEWVGLTSPFAAAFAVPLNMNLDATPDEMDYGNWPLYGAYVGFTIIFNMLLLVTMMWLFRVRWRVAG